jgi:gamma-glutamyl-gamma-aminobutyrate hydrolase PuuD
MPLIAIAACRKLEDYKQSILHVGGEVRIIDASMTVDVALASIDGLLLTGGDDVTPDRYGEAPHPTIVGAEPGRDEFEGALIAAARKTDLPILAICRGIQILNVACGGTLVQDIPSQVHGALIHNLESPPHQSYEFAHEVWLDKETLLASLMRERLRDTDACDVNSRHHQAVKEVAPGFKVSATAPDGVIEAIEDPNARFCVGVQWHPENFFRTGEFRPIFEGFLEAASRRA